LTTVEHGTRRSFQAGRIRHTTGVAEGALLYVRPDSRRQAQTQEQTEPHHLNLLCLISLFLSSPRFCEFLEKK